MKFCKVLSLLSVLSLSLVQASRSDFFGINDNRPEMFKLLDNEIGVLNITMDATVWETMKEKTHLKPWGAASAGEDYGTNNATMTFSVGDKVTTLNPSEFEIELGGKGSRNFSKPGYDIKIKKGELHELSHIRLRANVRDASMIREKLSSDYFYKMGLITTSTNYVYLNINDEFAGLYVLTDKVKKPFIKKYFGEKGTTHLYKCQDDGSRFEDNIIVKNCLNEDNDARSDLSEIQEFSDAVMNAKSVEDLEKIMDVDSFLKGLAFEYLTLSWDHFLILGHNYFWYKRQDGKWQIIYNDFDETFGENLWRSIYRREGNAYMDKSYFPDDDIYLNFYNLSIRDVELGHYIVKLLIHDDDTRWRKIVHESIKTMFNPTTMNQRIDEISELIRPGIIRDREIDPVTGVAPGRYNILGFNPPWTVQHFDENSNYVTWYTNIGQSHCFGLKFMIQERFKYVCHTYGINPDTLELIEPRPIVSYWPINRKYTDEHSGVLYEADTLYVTKTNLEKEDYYQEEYNRNNVENCCVPKDYKLGLTIYEKEGDQYQMPEDFETGGEVPSSSPSTTTISKTTTVATTTSQITATSTPVDSECWSEVFDYPCCKNSCKVYEVDEDGEWGYENDEWCGIVKSQCNNDCWATRIGYKCCSGCKVYDTDANGQWGYENDEWCGIITENC